MLLITILAISIQAPDTARVDTTRVRKLEDVTVTVTRAPQSLARVPASISIVTADQLQGSRATLGLNEALNAIPGVQIPNRYHFALDQRISIRGFGSRAPFGTRGIKVMLDGIPQTTPDGQSQFTNVDAAALGRVEVLRGSSSSMYGNSAGGAIVLTSRQLPAAGMESRARIEAGSNGLFKWQAESSTRSGKIGGRVSLSRTIMDGFRQNSAADLRQLTGMVMYSLAPLTKFSLTVNAADAPRTDNPGALTRAEFNANRDSAAANNILRGAGKDTRQLQGGLTLEHTDNDGNRTEITLFGYLRDIDNPIAAPSNPPASNAGTWVDLSRDVAGVRVSHNRRLGSDQRLPSLMIGLDAQTMTDDRRNWRSLSGERTDQLLLDQQEEVDQIGPFAQLSWTPDPRWNFNAGVRFDAFRFTATDRFFDDGEDNSGRRNMSAWSGSIGLSFVASPLIIPYIHLATSFETPTTSELSVRPGSAGGFSSDLDPQRAVSIEAGLRGETGDGRATWSIAAFRIGIDDAIVQFREIGGRAFFQNAGELINWGTEVAVSWSPTAFLRWSGAWTWSRFRFDDYRIEDGGQLTVLDGNTLPGLPTHFARLNLGFIPISSLQIDVEHTLSGSIWSDDLNTPAAKVAGWGPGITELRGLWRKGLRPLGSVTPFGGVSNLWNRKFVGSVVVNGAFGRVLEPGPGRTFYLGLEIGN